MNRLVQGDVGSGKTIVAVLALLETAMNGCQGALMAPTEVLAKQHYESITGLFSTYGIEMQVVLVTGSMTAKEKRLAYEKIASHEADIIVGTHALIQEKVEYKNLGLVITDEQHRFGVRQRDRTIGFRYSIIAHISIFGSPGPVDSLPCGTADCSWSIPLRQEDCDGQRLRPKLLEMVLRTAIQVRSVYETGRHVAQSTIRCAFTR